MNTTTSGTVTATYPVHVTVRGAVNRQELAAMIRREIRWWRRQNPRTFA
jgi:hypothetical protein